MGLKNDMLALELQNKFGVKLKPIFSSVTLLTLFLLVSFDIFLGAVKPLKFVHVAGTMLKDQDIVGCRIEQLLDKSSNFNSIILGDSTADDICVLPDVLKSVATLNNYSRYYYLNCAIGEDILKKNLSLPFALKNCSFGGSLISDQLLFVQNLLIHGNIPKIAFIMVVPRPFLDTTIDTKISPVQCYFDNRFKTVDFKADFLSSLDSWFSKFSNFYRTKSDYAVVMTSFFCSIFDRSANGSGQGLSKKNSLSFAGSEVSVNPRIAARPDWVLEESNHYKKAYAFNSKVYERQLECFDSMLSLLRKRNTSVVLVTLPLTNENLALLPVGFKKMFEKDMQKLVSKHNAFLFQLQEDRNFDKFDFLDNVHLNGEGGIKFWRALGEQLEKKSGLRESLVQSLGR
ncbi:MAG: hypothetical protein KIT34_16880 [Cyanobacteria bacterium TGS_CYA1]|nr:hypothetical protein [Cyanobacteria bacterium TGS_CYA1]